MRRANALAASLLLAVPSLARAEEAPPSPSSRSPRAAAKTLEITTIEGQILFPKVLFIAAEEPARYPETLHRIYWGSALDLGRATRLPKHIVVGATAPPVEGGETPPAVPLPQEPEPATSSPNQSEVSP